jgi:hypothetical protein
VRRLGIALCGAVIATASAVSKMLEGSNADLSWKELLMGAGVSIFMYAVKYRDDYSIDEVEDAARSAIKHWFPAVVKPDDDEEPPNDLTEPA